MAKLDALDTIAWSRLTHAYGSAADVPTQSRKLESGDASEREAAFHELFADMRERGVEALELLLPYLQHSDADMRIKVAESYAHYPAKAEVLIPALRSALDVANDLEVRATLQRSLQMLTTPV